MEKLQRSPKVKMELADASSVLSPLTDENSRSSQNSFGESEDSSHNRGKVEMEVPAEKVMSEDSLITEEMVKEESQLHKETLEEEMRLKAEHDEHMENMDEDLRREKYLRLQSLLTKSNAYTQFLLERMKRQREEEKKRQEKHGRLEKAKKQKKERQAELLKPVIGATMWPIDNVNGVVEPRSTCTENSTDVFLTSQQRRLTRSQERRENIIPCGEDSDSSLSWLSSQNSQKSHDLSAQRGQKRKTKKTMQDISKKLKLEKNFNMVENNVDDTDGLKQQDAPAECPKATESESHTAEAKDFVYLSELEDPVVENPTRIINGEPVPADQPVLFTGGVLRSYQVEGYKWLKILYENGINGILADEMGLGKTIQCIAIISHLVAMGVSGPYLICVPLSTLPNWFSEFKRFAPKVPIVLYHGSKEKRAELRNVIKKRCRIREDIEVHPVVITSYEITMNDRKLICKFEWKYLIVDEGHRIKNAASRLVRELKAYRGTHRLLLTGTPLQNNLSELWSLLNFLLPEIFNDLSSFEAWFDIENIAKEDADEKIVATEQKENILSMLHQILTPFMLRRLKSDVELIIPPKKEILVYAPFTKVQQTYYKALVDKSVSKLLDGKKSKEKVELKANGRPVRKASKHPVNYRNMLKSNCDDDDDIENLESWLKSVVELQKREGNEELNCRKNGLKYHSLVTVKLANVMMQLRKCCNHPYLLEYPLDPKSGDFMVDENLIRSCGKMLLLDKMLPQLKKQGHKVLIFSQMTSMLDVLQDYCYLRGIQYCRFDGKTPVEERQEQITDFNENEDIFLFLLSTRAGGLGINLTAADTVIVYDSDWNPQCDLQAQDRCHRIGQTRPVVVYKLITANTIDQKIVERAAAKRKLEKMVIHKGKFKSGMKHFTTSLTPVSPKDLMDLLKSDDHETIRGTDNNIISDDDLKKLLDRSDLYEKFSCAKKDKMSSEKNKATTPSLQWQDVEGVFKVVDSDETSGSLMCSILPRNAEN